MFNLKMKKLSIIAGAAVSAITLSAFSGFATGLPTEPLAEKSIGMSNEAGSSNEQEGNDSVNLPKDFSNKKMPEGSVITLDAPGNYRLVGAEAASISDNQDPNAIIVNTNDVIWIRGSGKYNVILDNVNIDNHNKGYYLYRTPIRTCENTEVNLILVGKNYLKSNMPEGGGLRVGSSLSITGSDEGASLDVSSKESGIVAKNIIINGGDIQVTSDKGNAIYSIETTINGGKIEITGSGGSAIYSNKTTINDGKIEVFRDDGDAICSKEITINSGDIQVTSDKGSAIFGDEMTFNGGNLKAISNSDWPIDCDTMTIQGGNKGIIEVFGPNNKGIRCKTMLFDKVDFINGVDVNEFIKTNDKRLSLGNSDL